MNNLILAFTCVAPLFLMMAVGAWMKKRRLVTDETLPSINNMIFRVFLPLLLFYNIYQTTIDRAFRPRMLAFAVAAVLAMYGAVLLFVVRIRRQPAKRGAMIQALFRSNFLILGLPIVESLFRPEQVGMTAVVIGVVIPMFNVLAVVTLEVFRSGRPNVRKILLGIARNPLIWASVLGILCLLAGVSLPMFIEKTVAGLAQVASPLALVCLGASLHFDRIRGNRRDLLICVLGRLVVIPGVMVPLAIALGFRGVELGTVMALFASPTAVTSFVMAQQMDSDSELAGQAVVFTSLFSCLSIFLWTFALKQGGWM